MLLIRPIVAITGWAVGAALLVNKAFIVVSVDVLFWGHAGWIAVILIRKMSKGCQTINDSAWSMVETLVIGYKKLRGTQIAINMTYNYINTFADPQCIFRIRGFQTMNTVNNTMACFQVIHTHRILKQSLPWKLWFNLSVVHPSPGDYHVTFYQLKHVPRTCATFSFWQFVTHVNLLPLALEVHVYYTILLITRRCTPDKLVRVLLNSLTHN